MLGTDLSGRVVGLIISDAAAVQGKPEGRDAKSAGSGYQQAGGSSLPDKSVQARKKARRDKWKQRRRELRANRTCGICGVVGKELQRGGMVIDHNHFTGWIRGWLCDPCNGRLGMFEHWTKKGYSWAESPMLDWIVTYYDKIIAQLGRNVGLKYNGGRKKFLKLA